MWPLAWQSRQATPRLTCSLRAILRLVELLLRKRRQQQAEAFDLLRVEQAVKELIVVVDGDQLALGDVAQIGTRGQEDGRWKFGQEVVRNIEVEVEACKIALLLLVDLIDFELGKSIPPSG